MHKIYKMNRERHETSSKRNFRETQSDAQLQLSYTKRQQTDKKTQNKYKEMQKKDVKWLKTKKILKRTIKETHNDHKEHAQCVIYM